MTNESPKVISLRDQTVTDLSTIFNNFFCLVVPEVQLEVSFSYKTVFEYLPPTKTYFSSRLKHKEKCLTEFQTLKVTSATKR